MDVIILTIEILICPECGANFPPSFGTIIQQCGKCPFCDTLSEAFLLKGVEDDNPIAKELLPVFPDFRLDLDEYDVELPFVERYANLVHLTEEDKKGLEVVVKLELIRAQVKTHLQAIHA